MVYPLEAKVAVVVGAGSPTSLILVHPSFALPAIGSARPGGGRNR